MEEYKMSVKLGRSQIIRHCKAQWEFEFQFKYNRKQIRIFKQFFLNLSSGVCCVCVCVQQTGQWVWKEGDLEASKVV